MKKFFKTIWNSIGSIIDLIVIFDGLVVGFLFTMFVFGDVMLTYEMQRVMAILVLLSPIFTLIYALKSLLNRRVGNE